MVPRGLAGTALTEIPVRLPSQGMAVAFVDDKDAPLVRMYSWHQTSVDGRVCTHLPRLMGKQRQTSLPRLLLGLHKDDPVCVMHLDGSKLNCTRANLRISARSQVMQGVTGSRGEMRGVCFVPRTGRWRVQQSVAGKQFHIGYFKTKELASAAACAWRRIHMPFSKEGRGL